MSNTVGYLHRIAFILLLVQGSVSARAQQNWFLYIQSETSQAFYVRIGETIYSSSPVGHLVINGLHDSTYRLAIGFPQSQYREHQFSIPVRKKDHGFELKKSDARSWVLYEWQTQETIRSPRTDSLLYGERKKDDGFASLMAAVVKDSAVLYTSVVKTEPPKKPATDSALVTKKTDAAAKDSRVAVQEKKQLDSVKTEPVLVNREQSKPDSVAKDTVAFIAKEKDTTALATNKPVVSEEKTPAVAKFYEQTLNNEKKLVFLDNTLGIKKDTITVIIPLENDSVVNAPKAVAKSETPKPGKEMTEAVPDSADLKAKTVVNEERSETVTTDTAQPLMDSIAAIQPVDTTRTVKAEMKKIDSTSVAVEKEAEPEKPSTLVMMNSDCSKFANDHDVDKLRVKMILQKDPGNRLYAAHKAFKNMCFSTKQIRALSELFPNDELKFQFFETAWPYVSDTSEFRTLEDQLNDPFFVTRFRTLLKRQ